MQNIPQPELFDKHIVIVDDDLPSLKYYETLFKNSGAGITILKNGKEFSDFIALEGVKADLIIMDFLIPFINGIDCTRLFRQNDKTTPVVMITAYYSDQIRSDSFVAGCNEFILKPVFPEKLLTLLDKYLIHRRFVAVN